MIFVDLETRSAVDLKKHGGWRYAFHPSASILCGCAIREDEILVWSPFPAVRDLRPSRWHPTAERLQALRIDSSALSYRVEQAVVPKLPNEVHVAHNADGFDALVLSRFGWEPEWLDSAPRARRAGYPGSLEGLSSRLFGFGKDKAGGLVMRKTSSPINAKRGFCLCGDCQDERLEEGLQKGVIEPRFLEPDVFRLEEIVRYCVLDTLLLACAWEDGRLGEPNPDDEVLRVHRIVDRRGIPIDRAAAAGLSEASSAETERAVSMAEAASGGAVTKRTLRSQTGLLRWLASQGLDKVPNVQAPTIEKLLDGELPGPVRPVLEARLAVSRVTGTKTDAILDRVSDDGRLRGWSVYFGAHTGRSSSRGAQMHNAPRATADLPEDLLEHIEDAPAVAEEQELTLPEVYSSLLRGTIVAPEGKYLAVCDLRQIEARMLLWMAGDQKGLDVYRQGGDPYVPVAAKLFKKPVESIQKGSPERHAGKVSVLACGYQGAADALLVMAQKERLDLAALGVKPEEVVEAFRNAHPLVAGVASGRFQDKEGRWQTRRTGGLWKAMQAAVTECLQTGKAREAGRCLWELRAPDLVCTLPSGRRIVYPEARMMECQTPWGPQMQPTYLWRHGRISTYGGKLTENAVQAACRDILFRAIVRLEDEGLCPVLHVHDEVVCEVPRMEDLARVEAIMRDPLPWAPDFPVDVEGFVGERYRK